MSTSSCMFHDKVHNLISLTSTDPYNPFSLALCSSGKWFPMNTASTPPAHTMATPTCSYRGSTSTSMRPPEASTFPEPCSSISSPARWTQSDQDRSVRSSDRTTSCSARAERGTTGPRVTTQRARSWSIPSLMLSGRRQRAAIVYR